MADNFPVITLTNPTFTASPFQKREPKGDSIKAVKLTDENVKDVAGHILQQLGGSVEVLQEDKIYVDSLYLARVGSWIVESYDYLAGKPDFNMASLADRQKYDLR